jgi:8-oxo-dGTP pyrophosphatase MutT (NUDIX family)
MCKDKNGVARCCPNEKVAYHNLSRDMNTAAGVIIFRQLEQSPIEYLLLQTSYGKHHWAPPKGHLKEGELPLQAAERETQEEAGLERSDFGI